MTLKKTSWKQNLLTSCLIKEWSSIKSNSLASKNKLSGTRQGTITESQSWHEWKFNETFTTASCQVESDLLKANECIALQSC